MRIILLTILLSGVLHSAIWAQADNPKYDKALAESLGADEYGMKMYTLVLLKTGPVQLKDKAKTDSLFKGHMENMDKMVKDGKLVVAGPLKKNDKNYRGIFILNVANVDSARQLLTTDPAIHAGLLEPEIYGWYGSAALPTYLPASEKVGKKNF